MYRKILLMLEAGTAAGEYQLLCANCNWIKRAENNEGGGDNRGIRR